MAQPGLPGSSDLGGNESCGGCKVSGQNSHLHLAFLGELHRSPDRGVLVPSTAERAMGEDLCELEAYGLIVKSGELYHCLCPDLLDKGIASLRKKLAPQKPGGCNRQSIGELR